MKKMVFLTVIIAFAFSCKKKSTTPAPSTGGTSPHTNAFTATVNGQSWTSCSMCFQETASGGLRSVSGRPVYSDFNRSLTFYFSKDTVGTFSFGGSNPYSCVYTDTSGTYFHSLAGQIIVTAVDTASNGVPNKFAATFHFDSDTIGGKHYSITNGTLDFKNP